MRDARSDWLAADGSQVPEPEMRHVATRYVPLERRDRSVRSRLPGDVRAATGGCRTGMSYLRRVRARNRKRDIARTVFHGTCGHVPAARSASFRVFAGIP